MKKKLSEKRIVFFLGAGASAAFNYPLTWQIFPLIRDRLQDGTLFPLSSNPKRERAKMKRLKKYLEDFFPAVFDGNIELPLITDILSLIDQFLETGEIAVPMFSIKQLEDFRTLMEEAIVGIIESAEKRVRTNKPLNHFADWILNAMDEYGVPVTIVTTNYDNLIESILFEKIDMANKHISDTVDLGFSWREHRTGTFLETIHQPSNMPRVRIYKLHGSLAWLRCPLCGFTYVNTTGSIFHQAFREDKVDYNNTCVCGHGPVRSVIVAPSMVRAIHDINLRTIWRSALEALRRGSEWIFVGYSLPPEDVAVRSILVRAFHGRGIKVKPPNVHIVEYTKDGTSAGKKDLEGRYRLLFKDCTFEYGGFQKYIGTLPKPRVLYPTF